jgi:hypothetical protein
MKPKLAPKSKGRLQISRTMSNRGPDVMSIEVVDDSSGVHFLRIDLTPHDLMCALTGRVTSIEMEIRGAHLIGTISEHKTELVKWKAYSQKTDDRKGLDDHERSPSVDKILAPFEIDGWRGSSSDLFNGHRSEGEFQRVGFHRYVDAKTGKPVLNP